MTKSEEHPAKTSNESADGKQASDDAENSRASDDRPRKKTLAGLGKLRAKLEKSKKAASAARKDEAESGDKSTALRIPKPSSRRNDDTEAEEDEAPPREDSAPRARSTMAFGSVEVGDAQDDSLDEESDTRTDQMSSQELEKNFGDLLDGAGPDDSGLHDDVELEADAADDFDGGEATMLTDSPFDAQAEPDFGAEAADEFDGGEATMLTDSPLGAEVSDAGEFEEVDKTMVSLTGSPAMDADYDAPASSVPATHATNPNPPTPEQKSRAGGFSSAPAHPEPDMQTEAPLDADDAEADDFQAEKTEVFDSPYENEALVPRLTIIEGPASGQEFLVNKQRNTVGRGKNNSIMVADLSMSRQHFEVHQTNDQSYVVVDLQSANGTRLNHTRIEEAELLHGDRIEAGKSKFQFVVPGNAPKRRPRNRHIVPKRDVSTPGNQTVVRQMGVPGEAEDDNTSKVLTYITFVAGGLSLLLVIPAAYLFLNDSPPPEAPAAEQPAAPAIDGQAQKLYLAAVEKVKDRDWDGARAQFEEVAALDPGFSGVRAQLERVAREKKAMQKLERAREFLASDNETRAAKLATEISSESVYFDDAQQVLRKTRQRRIAVLYQKAQEAVTAEEMETARAHLAAILEEVPNHKGALELRNTLDAAQQEAEEEVEEESRKQAARARVRRPSAQDDWLASASSGSSAKPSNSGSRRVVNFTKGFTLYKSGDFDAATAYFRSVDGPGSSRARQAADNIERFAQSYARANRAVDAGAWKTALDALAAAKRADTAVARSGYFKGPINEKLATAHGKLGLAAFSSGDHTGAARHYKKGKRYDNSNSTLSALRRELSNKARSLYIQAANKRKTDPSKAAELCRKIIGMVPSSHSMHQKAKKMLDDL